MLTTCPECQTTFRVTQEHLGLRRGLVRCGHCGVVFNAYDSLLAELVTPPVELEKPAREQVASHTEALLDPLDAVEIEPPPELSGLVKKPEAAAEVLLPAETPEPAAEPEAMPEAAPITPLPVVETSESILLSQLPTRIRTARPPLSPRLLLKIAAALLLVAVLLLQSTLFLRAELAAALPATRPFLSMLCEPLGCVVPLPRQLDKADIAASALEHDAENKSRARLTLLLANHSRQAQTWPHVVLILTDVRDAPVAQRVFSPAEYLAKGSRPETGMAAASEQEIRLDLDTGTLAATGYALDLTYR